MALTQQPSKWTRPSPTIRVGVLGLLAAVLLVLPLALAPRAEAYVYWNTESGIGRANLDGTAIDESFIVLGHPGAGSIAVDARHIYWIQNDGIGRAKLDGTGVDRRFIPESSDVIFDRGAALAIHEQHIYWTVGGERVAGGLAGNSSRRSMSSTSTGLGASRLRFRAGPTRRRSRARSSTARVSRGISSTRGVGRTSPWMTTTSTGRAATPSAASGSMGRL